MLNHLYTKWGKDLPAIPLNEYPRPSLKRDSFFCLNGEWEFYTDEEQSGNIIVPFCPESLLSGINKTYKKGTEFTYKKSFSLPEGFVKSKVFLHFGAVNQIADVYLNGTHLGNHQGGYIPFSFEISALLKKENILEVKVKNDFDDYVMPYGKQCRKRGGMWYTPTSGIWQTVWLESVPENYIEEININANLNKVSFEIKGAQTGEIIIDTPSGERILPFCNGKCDYFPENPELWSPENPYLYYCTIKTDTDFVQTYFAIRTLEIKSKNGIPRTLLNGKPYFFHGLLDQGYFSDGIFTPADIDAFRQDILTAKELGFNMLRKHIKIEPELFYYECDRLGIIVFQDMVNNGKYSFFRDTALPTIGIKKIPSFLNKRSQSEKNAFLTSMTETVSLLKKHPSICCWTIFNEGWGQFDADKMYDVLLSLDSMRFIDSASGWFKTKKNDFFSEHIYFKPVKLKESKKPIFLSEFGGYSFKPTGHVFNTEKTYGYRLFSDNMEFENAFIALYENEIIPHIEKGLCAAVYTQLTDVEDETNGLISYDRKVVKINKEKAKEISYKIQKTIFNE